MTGFELYRVRRDWRLKFYCERAIIKAMAYCFGCRPFADNCFKFSPDRFGNPNATEHTSQSLPLEFPRITVARKFALGIVRLVVAGLNLWRAFRSAVFPDSFLPTKAVTRSSGIQPLSSMLRKFWTSKSGSFQHLAQPFRNCLVAGAHPRNSKWQEQFHDANSLAGVVGGGLGAVSVHVHPKWSAIVGNCSPRAD